MKDEDLDKIWKSLTSDQKDKVTRAMRASREARRGKQLTRQAAKEASDISRRDAVVAKGRKEYIDLRRKAIEEALKKGKMGSKKGGFGTKFWKPGKKDTD